MVPSHATPEDSTTSPLWPLTLTLAKIAQRVALPPSEGRTQGHQSRSATPKSTGQRRESGVA
jgi:hypothetical protein